MQSVLVISCFMVVACAGAKASPDNQEQAQATRTEETVEATSETCSLQETFSEQFSPVLFEQGAHALTVQEGDALEKTAQAIAAAIKKEPVCVQNQHIALHAYPGVGEDSPLAEANGALILLAKRLREVRDVLASHGISPDDIVSIIHSQIEPDDARALKRGRITFALTTLSEVDTTLTGKNYVLEVEQ